MARNLSNTAASLLPYSTIEAAASGNVCLDEEKVCRMRTKLITKILDFKVNKTA